MAELKRDSVNRQQLASGDPGVVVLPISCLATPGTIVRLRHVREREIDCAVRNANAMADPKDGNAAGDAVMDASLNRSASTCSAGTGTIPETFFILAEDGGVISNGDTRYVQEHDKTTP